MTVETLTAARLPAVRTAVTALRMWTSRQVAAAVLGSVGVGLVIGVSTVLVPNSVFGRDIPTVAWNYPVWVVSSVLAGMLLATYVRPQAGVATAAEDPGGDRPARLGTLGGVLTWFAVGCPVCNKIALLALGYSGAITWFAPFQPVLAVGAIALTGWALLQRLRGRVACPVPGGAS